MDAAGATNPSSTKCQVALFCSRVSVSAEEMSQRTMLATRQSEPESTSRYHAPCAAMSITNAARSAEAAVFRLLRVALMARQRTWPEAAAGFATTGVTVIRTAEAFGGAGKRTRKLAAPARTNEPVTVS